MTIGMGLIDCGLVIQHLHIPALAQLTNRFSIAALHDPSPTVLRGVARCLPGALAHHNVDEQLADPDVGAVLVASPSALHAPHAVAAMQAGKHVLIEKPMCLTVDEADLLATTARDTGATVQIGYMRRHTPAFHEAARLVAGMQAGINIARLREIIGSNSAFVDPTALIITGDDVPQALRDEVSRVTRAAAVAVAGTDEGSRAFVHNLLLGLSTHSLSTIRGVLGMPKAVLSARHRREGRFLRVDFDYGDFVGHFETGVDRIARFDACLEVTDDTRIVRLNYDTPFIRHHPARVHLTEAAGNGVTETATQPPSQDAFVDEWLAFHQALSGGPIQTDVADARDDTVLIEQIMARLLG